MKTALAALMEIVALGGFAVRQWLKYQHQTLKYHMELAEISTSATSTIMLAFSIT